MVPVPRPLSADNMLPSIMLRAPRTRHLLTWNSYLTQAITIKYHSLFPVCVSRYRKSHWNLVCLILGNSPDYCDVENSTFDTGREVLLFHGTTAKMIPHWPWWWCCSTVNLSRVSFFVSGLCFPFSKVALKFVLVGIKISRAQLIFLGSMYDWAREIF